MDDCTIPVLVMLFLCCIAFFVGLGMGAAIKENEWYYKIKSCGEDLKNIQVKLGIIKEVKTKKDEKKKQSAK